MRAAEEKKLGDCSTIFGFFAFPGTTRLNFGAPQPPASRGNRAAGRPPPSGGPTGFARVGGFAAGPAARLRPLQGSWRLVILLRALGKAAGLLAFQRVPRLTNGLLRRIGHALPPLAGDHLYRLQRLLPGKDLNPCQAHRHIALRPNIGVIDAVRPAVISRALAPGKGRSGDTQHMGTAALVGGQAGIAPGDGIGDKDTGPLHRQRAAGSGKLKNKGGITDHGFSSLSACPSPPGGRAPRRVGRAARREAEEQPSHSRGVPARIPCGERADLIKCGVSCYAAAKQIANDPSILYNDGIDKK